MTGWDGAITPTGETMKRKENAKRQMVESRAMSGRVKKTNRWNRGECVSRGRGEELEGVEKNGAVNGG